MKKIIVVLTLVIAVLFLGAPYYTGKVAESEILKMVTAMNQSSAEYGSTEILDYKRRVRTTSARFKYTPPKSLAAMFTDFEYAILICDSNHGVVSINYTCSFEGETAFSKFVAQRLTGESPLSIVGSISAFGGMSQTISLDEIKGLEIDGATVDIPNAKISITSDTRGSEFQINGASDAFEMRGNGETVSIGKMSIHADFERVAELLFIGDLQLKLEHFDANGAAGITEIKNISVNSVASENGSTLSSNVVFSVKQITSSNMPFDSVENIAFSLDLNGLDKQALIEYQELNQQMQRDMITSLQNNTEPQPEAEQLAKLMPAFEKMLTAGLGIKSTVNAGLNGKPNKVGIEIELLEQLSLEQLPLFMTAPHEAIKSIDSSVSASFDKALVDSQPLAEMFVAKSPLVKPSNDHYSLNLKLGKTIELNGKSMTFSELQTLVFSSLPFKP